MKKFENILFCTDFDGTLASGTDISEENLKAIKYFQSEGGLFTVATGRFPSYIGEFKDKFMPNTYRIWLNGTLICDEADNIIFQKKISIDAALTLTEFIKQRCTDLERILYYNIDGSRDYFTGDYDPYKMIAVTNTPEGCLEFKKIITDKFSDKFFISRSWPTGLEIIDITAGKGVCVTKLKELTGRKNLVCIGDFENDSEMIRAADIGIATANALPEIKAIADIITENDYTSAVAEMIYKFETMTF